MTTMSKFLLGKTYGEEIIERQRRRDADLKIQTFYDKSRSHWDTQQEIRSWFFEIFNEILLWECGISGKNYSSHVWLPRTREQAMLLKLIWGGER